MFCLRHISLDSQYVEVMNPNISHFYSYEGQIIYRTYTFILILIEKYFYTTYKTTSDKEIYTLFKISHYKSLIAVELLAIHENTPLLIYWIFPTHLRLKVWRYYEEWLNLFLVMYGNRKSYCVWCNTKLWAQGRLLLLLRSLLGICEAQLHI